LHEQLPQALSLRPQLASVVVGINDAMRSTFDPARMRADLFTVADQLTGAGASLLMVRFHDHGRVFGLPGLLRGPLARRIEAINAVYDEIHAVFGGTYVDLAAWPEVYTRAAWSVDRLHPSERGHRQLARTFAELLHAAGLGAPPPALELGGGIAPSRWAELAWLITKGLPWVGRRTRDLGLWATKLALTELLAIMRHHSVRRQFAERAPVGSKACHEWMPEPPTSSARSGSPAAGSTTPKGRLSSSSGVPACSAPRVSPRASRAGAATPASVG
jgi:GDSL-like lipase/acylhydrolase family protein